MNKREIALKILLDQKLLPLFYHEDVETSKEIINSLYQAGVRIIEYTNRGSKALENFRKIKKYTENKLPDLLLGIGTIKNKEEVKKFIKCRPDFIVCPSINVEIGKIVHKENLLWIPGCMTATEIASAENAGATLVKIFPGSLLGPTYINSIKEIFPEMRFMPTGGVEANEANLIEWFDAGVVAIGMGSKLITKQIIKENNFSQLTKDVIEILASIKNISENSTDKN